MGKDVENSTGRQEESIENLIQNEVENTEEEIEKLVENEVEKPVEEETEKLAENEVEKPVEEEIEKLAEDEVENSVEEEIENLVENEMDDLVNEKILESPVENEVANTLEEIVETVQDKPIKKYKKIITGIIITLCTLLLLYFGMTTYFMNHFYFDSEINGIGVSWKSIEDVEGLMESKLQEYTLTLKELGGKREQIKAVEVGLRYNSGEEFAKLKHSQNPFGWFLAYFKNKKSKMTVEVTYDEKLLKERIDALACFESKNVIQPENSRFEYIDNKYVVVDEIHGNKVDKDILYSHVGEAILKKEAEINLELINCYITPQYTSKSQKTLEVKDILNKYISSKIIYIFGKSIEILDGTTINNWLTVNENFEVVVDEKKVEGYVDLLSEKYTSSGMVRNFVTSAGSTIQISGGDFSRPINKDKEVQNLISIIKEGRTIIKEPVYGENIFSYGNNDIGNTYVEINLTKQHIWFYKNSSLIVEGNVVTGNLSSGHATPKGVYTLKYKTKNAILRGPGYACPVNFWMPFNGGIGIHDANWRGAFGGNIYKTNGSHGCINCPNNVAKEIYNYIEPGTPVVCY